MSRVSELALAARSPTAKFHELRLKYWSENLDIVCCFEGSDDIEFYMRSIRSSLGIHNDRIDFVNCGGKGVVLKLLGWVNQRFWNDSRLGFFVDRDLDDFLAGNVTDDKLYITDYYSIESHASDNDIFDNVWQDLFRLPIADARRVAWKDAYYNGLGVIANGLLPTLYVATAIKRSGGCVDLDKIVLNVLFSFSEDGCVREIRARGHPMYMHAFKGFKVALAGLRSARQDLLKSEPKLWVRGKFILWYSMEFFNRMKIALGARGQSPRAVVRAVFNAELGMSCISARCSTPESLRIFLENWSNRIVENGLERTGAS